MNMTTFRALWVEEISDNVFETSVTELSLDDLPHGEVLIQVHYSSLNYKDALSASGNRGVTRHYPHTPGIDAAGVVVSDSGGQFHRGDQVLVTGYDLGMNTAGGLAEYIRVPSAWVVPLPEELTLRESMVYGTAGLTAALCLEKLLLAGADPTDGEVIVTGATGGVGSIAIALLAKLRFSVTAVTGKLEASAELRALGAKKVLDRDTLLENSGRSLLKPICAHAIDTLGGEYLFTLLRSLQYGGSVAACGMAAGVSFSGNVFPFILRGVNLLGVDSVELPKATKARMWQKLATEYCLPAQPGMAEEISLEQVPQYLDRILNGHAQGRYVVRLRNSS